MFDSTPNQSFGRRLNPCATDGVAISPDGSFALVGDQKIQRVRRIALKTGQVTTFAGDGSQAYADGTGTAAKFKQPRDVAISPDGSFALVADRDNNRIRHIVMGTGEVRLWRDLFAPAQP